MFLLSIIATTIASNAQETALSVSIHMPLLCKVLSLDRNIKQRSSSVVTIALVYQSKFRTSLNTVNDIQHYFSENAVKISGMPVVVRLIDLSEDNVASILTSENITALYIAPVRAYNVTGLHDICSTKKIRSMTGVVDYLNLGISVGIGTKGGQSEIIINRQSCISEGADFTAQLLKLARIIE